MRGCHRARSKGARKVAVWKGVCFSDFFFFPKRNFRRMLRVREGFLGGGELILCQVEGLKAEIVKVRWKERYH